LVWQTILPDLDLPKWFAKSFWHLDLANHFADLDLSKWFAKSIWHLDLANHFAGPRFA
jgi:hypothetical protein